MPIRLADGVWEQCNETEFVQCWSRRYAYSIEFLYDENIQTAGAQLDPLTERNLTLLWVWKTWGGPAGQRNLEATVARCVTVLDGVNRVRAGDERVDLEAIARYVSEGPVYQAFLRHIANPIGYPILDRNVYAAYLWARTPGITLRELPEELPDDLREDWPEFVTGLADQSYAGVRAADRALQMFGRRLREARPEENIPAW